MERITRLASVWGGTFIFFCAPLLVHAADLETNKSVGTAISSIVSIATLGAKGDGISDDSKAEQDAIDKAAPFSTVLWPAGKACYLTRTTLIVRKPIILAGAGTLCFKQGPGLRIATDNFSINGLTLVGPQSDLYSLSEVALFISGEFHAGSPPHFLSKLSIENVRIRSWGGYGIYFAYVDGFRVAKNEIDNIGYAGVGGISVRNGVIDSNSVHRIGAVGDPDNNSYGVFVSRSTSDAGDLVSQPRSMNVVISKNFVDGVPTWEALDTHAGNNIQFIENTTTNSNVGVAAVSSKNHLGAYVFGPLNIVIRGNRVSSGVDDGTRGVGVYLEGTATESATGRVAENVVTAFGTANSSRGAAINITQTYGVTVAQNIIHAPSPSGIFSGGAATKVNITRNVITDPWTDAPVVAFVSCINFIGEGNSAQVSDNQCNERASKHFFNLQSSASAAVRMPAFSKEDIQLSRNGTNARNAVSYTPGGINHVLHNLAPSRSH